MFIFQSKFNNPLYRDRNTEKSGTSKKNQRDFQISKVGSLDFLDLNVNGSPVFSVQIFMKVNLQPYILSSRIQFEP